MSTTNEQRHNGYRNYQTWAVSNWIANDVHEYNEWTYVARKYSESAKHDGNVLDGIWTEDEAKLFRLADKLKMRFETESEDKEDIYEPFRSLLYSALDMVAWDEVARAIFGYIGENV